MMYKQIRRDRLWLPVAMLTLFLIVQILTHYGSKWLTGGKVLPLQYVDLIEVMLFLICISPVIYFFGKHYVNATLEERRKFEALVRQNVAGIFIYRNNRFEYVNPMFAQMVGYTKQDLVNGNIALEDIVEPDYLEVVKELGHENTNDQEMRHYEVKVKTKSGETKWFEVYSVKGAYRKKHATIGTVIDRTNNKTLDMELARKEQQYRALFENHPNAVYSLDTKGRFIQINSVGPTILGHSVDELIGTEFMPYVKSVDLPKTMALFQQVLNGESQLMELEVIRKDGTHRKIQVICIPIQIDGIVEGVHGVAKDVTDEEKFEELRVGEKRILEMIASGAELPRVLNELITVAQTQFSDGLSYIYLLADDKQELVLTAGAGLSDECHGQFDVIEVAPQNGSSSAAVLSKKSVITTDIATDPRCAKTRDAALACGLHACWSIPILSASQEILGVFALSFRSEQVPEDHELDLIETFSYLAGLAIERHHNEEYINHLAYYDSLTNLPNRRLFFERLSRTLEYAKQHQQKFAVMYVDVDRFKQMNDSFGHSGGDSLLREVSRRLTSSVRASDLVARIGGDEFSVILSPIRGTEEAITIAEQVIRACNQSFSYKGATFPLTASVGIAVFPGHGDDVTTLIQNADVAMYTAKLSGKNHFRLYNQSMPTKALESLMLESDMNKALGNRELALYYQPRVSAKTGEIVGAEALIRWNHPLRGSIPPSEIIGIAEESGFIVPLGKWVIHEACRQYKAWQDHGYPPIRISVNVSALQFSDNHIVQTIKQALEESGLDPQYLEVEITEGTIMKHEQAIVGILSDLKRMGIHISIDDFGTGYSSLNYLRQFKVDALKIDRSFVIGIPNVRDDAIIADSIIALAHALNLKVVAEGVETEVQLEFLRNRDCDEIQGYYTGRPVPPEDFCNFMTKGGMEREASSNVGLNQFPHM